MRWILAALTLTLALVCSAPAQSIHRSDEVTGMMGSVKLIPNASASYTTAVFTSNTPISEASSQIVFVLQGSHSAVPKAWSGSVRLFLGDGFLAIAADDSDLKYLFKFNDRGIPAPLAEKGYTLFDIVGIARYGEKKPLTEAEITSLATRATTRAPRPKKMAPEFPTGPISGATPLNDPEKPAL